MYPESLVNCVCGGGKQMLRFSPDVAIKNGNKLLITKDADKRL